MGQTEGTQDTNTSTAPAEGQGQLQAQPDAPAIDVAKIQADIEAKLTKTLGEKHQAEIAKLTQQQQQAAQVLLGQNPTAKQKSAFVEGLKQGGDDYIAAVLTQNNQELEKRIEAKIRSEDAKKSEVNNKVASIVGEYHSKYSFSDKQNEAITSMVLGLEASGKDRAEAVEIAFKTFVDSAGVKEKAPQQDGVVPSFGQARAELAASRQKANLNAIAEENKRKAATRDWRNRH